MKFIRRFIITLLLLGMLTGAARVYAAPQKDYSGAFFEGRTLEEIMEEFVKQHYTIEGTVGAGYKNLISGEEFYYMPDKLFLAASTYKVPLNMYWSNLVYKGEIGWDYQVYGSTYDKAMEWSIVNSNNEYSIALWEKLGSFSNFRNLMLPLLGTTVEQVEKEPLFYKENYFSPRMMIHCLEELYTNSEQYPRVIDLMLQAKPGQYFKAHDHEAQIAHKFGYLEESALVVNDSAIVFTEDPIAIVVFTQNAYNGYDWLVDFCDMMIAYTDYYTPIRKQAENEAAARAEAEAEAARGERLRVFDEESAGAAGIISSAIDGAAAEYETALTGIAIAAPEMPEEEIPADRSLAIYITAAAAGLVGIFILLSAIIRRRGALTGILGTLVLLAAAGFLLMNVLKPAQKAEKTDPGAPEAALQVFNLTGGENSDEGREGLAGFMKGALACRELEEARVDGYMARLRVSISAADAEKMKSLALDHAGRELESFRSELENGKEADTEAIQSRIGDIITAAIEKACSVSAVKSAETELEIVFTGGSWQIIQSPALSAAMSTAG